MKSKIAGVLGRVASAAFTLAAVGANSSLLAADSGPKRSGDVPSFRYDPDWPKTLPNAWITGNIGAITVDKNDRIWVVQRPASTTSLGERDALDGKGDCCNPAPPIIVFDRDGGVVKSWGPIHILDPQTKTQRVVLSKTEEAYPDYWPSNEHGIYVDHKDNVWLSNSSPPSQIVKFTNDGKLLLRIGKEQGKSNSDTQNLGGPAGIYVDPQNNEVFVADGYQNRRVIVFDADTGAYKRHWGAYGKPPIDAQHNNGDSNPDFKKRNEQFALAHCIGGSNDGLIYVCDRTNSRVQVFKKDGSYVTEVFVEPRQTGLGTVYALGFSSDPEQRFLYVGDGSNKKIHILERKGLNIVGSFGTGGHGGGQFGLIHSIITDKSGNLYVGETLTTNRVQRFNLVGARSAAAK